MFASDKDPRCQGQIRRRAVIDDIDFPAQKEPSHHGTTSFETSDLVKANPSRDSLFQKANWVHMCIVGNDIVLPNNLSSATSVVYRQRKRKVETKNVEAGKTPARNRKE